MFIAALFIIAKTWKQPRMNTDEVVIHMMKYYLAIKK